MRRWGVNNLPNFCCAAASRPRLEPTTLGSQAMILTIQYIYSTVNYNIILAIASTLHTVMKHLVHTCVLHLELTTELLYMKFSEIE